MWRSRMFWRLFAAQAVLLLAAIGLLGAFIVQRVERHYLQQLDERLRVKALLVRELTLAPGAVPKDELQRRVQRLGRETRTRLTLLNEKGDVLADSQEDPGRMKNHLGRPEVQQAREHGFGKSTRFSATVHEEMSYAALRVDAPGQPVFYVRVALPLDQIQDELARLRGLVWTAVGATALAAMAVAFFLARRITRPLQELTAG